MPDEPSPLAANEIEDLLRRAQTGGGSPEAPPDEGEIASLLSQGSNRLHESDATEGRVADADVEFLLDQAQQALESVDHPTQPDPLMGLAPFKLEEFGGAPPSADVATLELIRDVELDLKIELGRTQMCLEDVLKLHKGSVVPLDKLAGDPVDIYVNGRLIARGEVLVLNDNFCVRVAELITAEAARTS